LDTHSYIYIYINVARIEEMKSAYKILIEKTEGKRPRRRHRRRWENNIGVDNRREIGREGMDWIYLAQDRD